MLCVLARPRGHDLLLISRGARSDLRYGQLHLQPVLAVEQREPAAAGVARAPASGAPILERDSLIQGQGAQEQVIAQEGKKQPAK